MTTNEKIAALRAAAKAAGADGVLIMTSDPHCSEYLPGYYNALPWFSGFIGENSTLVVTQDRSALWCDGRFYVQADKQLAGSEIECMHAGSAGVPTVAEYLESHFADGQTLLLDGSCVPATIAKEYIDALAKKGASLKSQDVASPIWDATGERPALPDTPCELLTPAQTGATAADRIAMVRAELQKAGATALAVTGLDCVGWLLNLRARDLPCTPLAVAYALVTMDACTLFIAPGRLSDADAATLAESGVTLRGYEEIIDAVHALPADEVFLVDEKATNYALYEALTAYKTVAGADPIFALKGIKNETELKNIRECHIRDGVAVVRFQMDRRGRREQRHRAARLPAGGQRRPVRLRHHRHHPHLPRRPADRQRAPLLHLGAAEPHRHGPRGVPGLLHRLCAGYLCPRPGLGAQGQLPLRHRPRRRLYLRRTRGPAEPAPEQPRDF